MPSADVGGDVRRNRALNCSPWVRLLTHSPEAVIHSPAAMVVDRPPALALTHFWCSCSHCADETRLEQIDFCTPIHLTLHQFELRDLAFGLTIRP